MQPAGFFLILLCFVITSEFRFSKEKMARRFLPLFLMASYLCCVARADVASSVRINVLRNASSAECLQAVPSTSSNSLLNCSTLGRALDVLHSYPAITNASVVVFYSHTLTPDSPDQTLLSGRDAVEISGQGGIRMTCPGLGTGIAFEHVGMVTVRGISWVNCSVGHNTTTHLSTDSSKKYNCMKAYSALYFYSCSHVAILNCTFMSAVGSGVSIYDPVRGGSVTVQHSFFLGHSVLPSLDCNRVVNSSCSPQAIGLYIETTFCGRLCNCSTPISHELIEYNISNCVFRDNKNPSLLESYVNAAILDYQDFWPFGSGGGLAMIFHGQFQNNSVVVSECVFHNNTALEGGGMALQLYFRPAANTIAIYKCNFTDNKAMDSGGGLRLGAVYLETTPLSETLNGLAVNTGPSPSTSAYEFGSRGLFPVQESDITISNTLFTSNTATKWGGGMSAYSSVNTQPYFTLKMTECAWDQNTAKSAAAVGFTQWIEHNVSQAADFTVFPECYNCSFTHNLIALNSSSSSVGYGTVFLQGVPMAFFLNTTFWKNAESALCISSTFVEFHDEVHFQYNAGLVGGALYLLGVSQIVLYPRLSMVFDANTAFQYGGAIYYTYPPSLSLTSFGTRNCFIKYQSQSGAALPLSQWNVTVFFTNNKASQAGDAAYISNPDECTFEDGENPFNTTSNHKFIYHLFPTVHELSVSTPAIKVNFKDLNQTTVSGFRWYTYTVQPGGVFNVSLIVEDFFQNRTITAVSIACHLIDDYIKSDFSDNRCDGGPEADFFLPSDLSREFTINDSLRSLQIGGHENTEFVLVLKTSGLQPVITPLLVHLKKCSFGYLFDSTTNTCRCFSDVLHSVSDIDTQCLNTNVSKIFCIRDGFWFGEVGHNKTDNTTYGIQTCQFGTCSSDYCQPCYEFHGWCKVPTDPDDFCDHGRTGVLCSLCKPDYSLSYDSYHCVKCSPGKTIALLFIFLAYWFIVIVGILVIMKFDLRIGSGYVFSFLYYFSVVKYVMYFDVPPYVAALLNWFGSLARLDPLFLVYSNLCFYPGITSLQYEMIHYLHPAVVIATIFGLILLDKVCPRLDIFSGRSAVQALCFILLLAYTSLAETSLNIFNPLRYINTYPENQALTVVQLQPATLYLHTTDHLPYFLAALLIELVIVIPFAVFMAIAPWLGRKINLIRIKPILDEYQSCYKNEYRWFAGVYLIGRQLFFITSIWVISLDVSLLLNQIFCVAILLLHAIVQPYRKKWLNALDTIFLLDLTLLSLLYGRTGTLALEWNSRARNGFVMILVLLPCLYAIFGMAVKTVKFIGNKRCCRGFNKRVSRAFAFLSGSRSETNPPANSDLEDSLPSRLLEEEFQQRRSSAVSSKAPSVTGAKSTRANETRPLLGDHSSTSGSEKSRKWYQQLGNLLPRRNHSSSTSPSSTDS